MALSQLLLQGDKQGRSNVIVDRSTEGLGTFELPSRNVNRDETDCVPKGLDLSNVSFMILFSLVD